MKTCLYLLYRYTVFFINYADKNKLNMNIMYHKEYDPIFKKHAV